MKIQAERFYRPLASTNRSSRHYNSEDNADIFTTMKTSNFIQKTIFLMRLQSSLLLVWKYIPGLAQWSQWSEVWYKLIYSSEVPGASIIRAKSVNFYQTTRHNTPEDSQLRKVSYPVLALRHLHYGRYREVQHTDRHTRAQKLICSNK
jgi:hypothetical protein